MPENEKIVIEKYENGENPAFPYCNHFGYKIRKVDGKKLWDIVIFDIDKMKNFGASGVIYGYKCGILVEPFGISCVYKDIEKLLHNKKKVKMDFDKFIEELAPLTLRFLRQTQ